MQASVILAGSFVVFYIITSFSTLREWRRAITSRRTPAFSVLLALSITLLGSTESANINALLPDPLRMARALLTGILFIFSLHQLAQHSNSWRLAGSGAQWMVFFSILGIVSATWSSSAIISVWKGFEILTFSLAVLSVAYQLKSEQDIRWLLNTLSAGLLYVSITVLVGLLLFPSEAIKNPDTTYTQHYFSVRGLAPILNPASVGTIGSILFVAAFSSTLISSRERLARWSPGIWIAMGIGATDMIIAHSRTPILGCTIAVCAMLFYARRFKLLLIAAVSGVLIIAATTLGDIFLSYMYRGQTEATFTSLTGRLGFWEQVTDFISESPIIGHGYYAGQRLHFSTNSVDNAFLGVLVGLGFVGLIVFLTPIIYGAINLLRTRPRSSIISHLDSLWLQVMGIFGILLIRSLTGTSFQVLHPLFIVYMTTQVSISALVRSRRISIQTLSSENVVSNTGSPQNRGELRILRKRRQKN